MGHDSLVAAGLLRATPRRVQSSSACERKLDSGKRRGFFRVRLLQGEWYANFAAI